MSKVVIIGGGVTGLSAAHAIEEARRRGEDIDYLLLEKDHRLGGKVRTEKVDGYTVEAGPDCFLSHKPQVIQMADELDFSDQLLGSNEASKRTYVYSRSKLHRLPDGMMLMIPAKILPFAMSPLISWPGKIRMGLDLLIPKKKDNREETVAEFVTRRLGREALDKIAEPLIAGVHAGDPETMSINGMESMLKMEENYGSLIRAMLASRRRPPGAPKGWKKGQVALVSKAKIPQTFFMTFKGGNQELINQLVSTCDSSKLLTGREVTKVEERPGGGFVVHVDGMEPVVADAVIVSTLPSFAADILKNIDNELSTLLETIPQVNSATVSLGFRHSAVGDKVDGFGFVVPLVEKRKIMACTYSSSKWSYRTPDDDHVLIRAFVGGAKNQHLVELDDDEMLAMVLSELKDIMGIDEKPELVKIFRWFKGMPQYNVGHAGRVDKMMELAANHAGLYLAGGAYRGVGIPNCMESGLTAAKEVVEFLNESVAACC